MLLLGGLLGAAGVASWIVLSWKAIEGFDEISAHSNEGGDLLVWALIGTLLMIVGSVILYVAQIEEE